MFSIANNQQDRVPEPYVTWTNANTANMVEQIIKMTASCLNSALKSASTRTVPNNGIFSPQNWIKSKQSLNDINFAIQNYIDMLSYMDGGEDQYKKLMDTLAMNQTNFEYRLQAD